MKSILFAAFFLSASLLSAQDIHLPSPQKEGGKPLMTVLNQRHSTRDYSEQALSKQQLSDLLWAAFGYNRGEQKKRTAPSSMNHQEIEIYVALPDGLFFYDAKNHLLIQKGKDDIRSATGKQDFVKNAALNLIYVANYAENPKISEEKSLHSSYVNTGFISQNVYLYCTSEGLGTVVRGWFDGDKLSAVMNLPEGHKIILTQTVGLKE